MAITYNPKVWVGPQFEEIFSEVLYANNTVDKGLVRFLQNIKSSTQLTTLGGAPVVQNYALTPSTPQGNLNFSDVTLAPVKRMVHDRFDMNQMLNTQFSEDMPAGAANMNSPKYLKAVEAYLIPRISKAIEAAFWQLITDSLGAATTNIDRVGAVLTASNILDEIKAIYAAIPGEVLATGEAKMYLPMAAKQLVLIANSDRTYRDLLTVNGESISYLDCPIEFVPVAANTIVAGRASDFIWGTDLLSDEGSLEVNKVTNESDEMFYKLVFTLGAAVCVPTQKVLSKPGA
jgi:hypothetical protein